MIEMRMKSHAVAALAAASLMAAAAAHAKGSYYVIATLISKPDDAAAVRKLLVPAVSSFRKEDGCLSYALLEDTRRPGRFMTYEKWTNEAALAAHMKAPTLTSLGPKLKPLLEGDLTQDFLELRAAR